MLPKNKLASAQLTQAQDLRRPRAPARRPGAEAAGVLVTEIAQYLGTGKRKTSVARVILRPGDGKTWINGRTLEEYFPRAMHRKMVLAPLEVAEAASTYDLRVRVARRRHLRARPARSGTGSPARSSRRIPRCASR